MTADAILLAALGVAVTSETADVSSLSIGAKVLLGLSFCALTAGLLLDLQAILPNRKNLLGNRTSSAPRFMVQFAWIASRTPGAYPGLARDARPDDLDDDIALAVEAKARWAVRKLWLLYAAILSTQAGAIAGFLAVAVEAVARAGAE